MVPRVNGGDRSRNDNSSSKFVLEVREKRLIPVRAIKANEKRKMSNELFDNEEAFVLDALELPPPPPQQQQPPFVLEGWDADGEHATPPRTPYDIPRGHRLHQRALRRRQKAEEARKKAAVPRMSRVFAYLADLQRRFLNSLKGRVQRVRDSIMGAGRKRVAEDGGESNTPAKRVRLDDDEAGSVASEDHVEGQADHQAVPDFDVNPDFGFDDFDYHEEEDRDATIAIHAAGDDFNGDNNNNIEAGADHQAPEHAEEVDVDAGDVEMVEAGIGEEAPQPDAVQVEAAIPAPPRVQPHKPPSHDRNTIRRIERLNPFAVIDRSEGDGFEVRLLANGTAKIVGSIAGIDANRSSFFKGLGKDGVTIKAPHYRIVEVVAGHNHAILRTSRGRIMIVGSNELGQLGTSRRGQLRRVATQTLGSIQRGPFGMAGRKIRSILARGSESWAWDSDGKAYRCGTAMDGTWACSTFVPDPTQDLGQP